MWNKETILHLVRHTMVSIESSYKKTSEIYRHLTSEERLKSL